MQRSHTAAMGQSRNHRRAQVACHKEKPAQQIKEHRQHGVADVCVKTHRASIAACARQRWALLPAACSPHLRSLMRWSITSLRRLSSSSLWRLRSRARSLEGWEGAGGWSVRMFWCGVAIAAGLGCVQQPDM